MDEKCLLNAGNRILSGGCAPKYGEMSRKTVRSARKRWEVSPKC